VQLALLSCWAPVKSLAVTCVLADEDVVMGYPWLAAYEPKFNWKYATIDETTLPVVLQSINPQANPKSIIAQTNSEKEEIIAALESQCSI